MARLLNGAPPPKSDNNSNWRYEKIWWISLCPKCLICHVPGGQMTTIVCHHFGSRGEYSWQYFWEYSLGNTFSQILCKYSWKNLHLLAKYSWGNTFGNIVGKILLEDEESYLKPGTARYRQVQQMTTRNSHCDICVRTCISVAALLPVCAEEEFMFYLGDFRCRNYVVASSADGIKSNGKEDDTCICENNLLKVLLALQVQYQISNKFYQG